MPTLLSVRGHLAHVFDGSGSGDHWLVLIAGCVVLVLVIQHHVVAAFDRQEIRRRLRVAAGLLASFALAAVAVPAGGAQGAGALLPDLISDPPRPSFFNELNTPDGSTRLVVTFDGYVHNIGDGALDVVGNPQVPGGMRQRVLTDGEWEDAGAPTVRFETDDGHNHFHLIEVIEYVLWNELQGAQTAIGSKIGFCLVDSEQMEPGFDQAYSEELDNFCQENNPGATSLRMGISPGWRDIYDATTTLQWVDVSAVPPGRYWLGAITDPNDEVVESNEENNDLIFSEETITVPGFLPRPQPPIVVDDPSVEVTLEAVAHGTVTSPVYVIIEGPTSGELDVPIGADLGSPVVRYYPEPGFEGTVEIEYSVHDAASPYPLVRPTQTVVLEVIAGAAEAGDDVPSRDPARDPTPSLSAPSTFFESRFGEAQTVEIDATDADGDPARLFARGLPAGIVADPDTGTIEGVAVEEGIFDVELVAIGKTPDEIATLNVSWIVNPQAGAGGLTAVPDQSSPRGGLTRITTGGRVLGLTIEADGLPPGLALEPGAPVISGTPTEAGDFPVTLRQLEDGEVVTETNFVWTIRPTTDVEFVL